MQAEQTQTHATRSKNIKSKVYMYTLGVSVAILMGAYIWATYYYKFVEVDAEGMGMKFYSWRALQADKEMFGKKLGKYSDKTEAAETNKYLKGYLSDQFGEHAPREVENYMSMAHTNMDFVLVLRKAIVKEDIANIELTKEKKEVEDEAAKRKAKNDDTPVEPKPTQKYVKTSSVPLYLSERTEEEILEAVDSALQSSEIGERSSTMKQALVQTMQLFVSIATDKAYKYDGMKPSEKTVSDMAELIQTMSKDAEMQPELIKAYASVSKNAHIKRFVSKRKIDTTSTEKMAESLAHGFLTEMTQGTLSPFYSFAYSRMAYVIYYMTLDAELTTSQTEEKTESMEDKQKYAQSRTMAVGKAIAYAIAKSMSNDITKEAVTKNRNIITSTLFTQSLEEPDSDVEGNLNTIVQSLKSKIQKIGAQSAE